MYTPGSWIPLTLLAFLTQPASVVAQATRIYAHPGHPVSIEAPPDWQAAAWPGDPGVFEVRAPDGSVHALLWFTATEMDALRYLNKMIGMEPLSPIGEPVRREIDGRESWQIVAFGDEQGNVDVRETLTVSNAGPGAPTRGNFVLQIWSPAAMADSLAPVLEEIAGTLRIRSTRGLR